MTGWVEKLDSVARQANTLACVGLDPDPALMPVDDVFVFNRSIIDATHDLVCAYKPQLAFYEALGIEGLQALGATVEHIRRVAPEVVVVGDAKRGDIGTTAAAYARAMFEVWDFDVVTVHPYLGRDGTQPFLEYEDRGVLVVCRTSNPGARELQDVKLSSSGGQTVYQRVAEMASEWNERGNVGLVVGATYPEELAQMRSAHPSMPILVPGVGAQGGDPGVAASAGANADGRGMLVSSSRGIIYASSDKASYPDAARAATLELRDGINAALSVTA